MYCGASRSPIIAGTEAYATIQLTGMETYITVHANRLVFLVS